MGGCPKSRKSCTVLVQKRIKKRWLHLHLLKTCWFWRPESDSMAYIGPPVRQVLFNHPQIDVNLCCCAFNDSPLTAIFSGNVKKALPTLMNSGLFCSHIRFVPLGTMMMMMMMMMMMVPLTTGNPTPVTRLPPGTTRFRGWTRRVAMKSLLSGIFRCRFQRSKRPSPWCWGEIYNYYTACTWSNPIAG